MLVHLEKIPQQYQQAFEQKVRWIANEFDIYPEWLMEIMNNESSMQSSIVNSIGCVGLIQFCPGTPETLGTSLSALRIMSPVQQLDYVYYYYKAYKNKIKRFGDLYLIAFYPYAVGRSDDYIIGSEKSLSYAALVAAQNKVFDTNNDGYITLKDFYDAMKVKFPNVQELPPSIILKKTIIANSGFIVGGILLVLAVLLFSK